MTLEMKAPPLPKDEEGSVFLDKASILSAHDTPIEKVNVPEWGGHVYVKVLSGAERDRFDQSVLDRHGKPTNLQGARARLAAITLCDKDGRRLFSDQEINQLADKSAAAIERVCEAAMKLNRMGEQLGESIESGVSGSD